MATIAPDELRADSAYYAQAAQGASSQVQQNEAALRMGVNLFAYAVGYGG